MDIKKYLLDIGYDETDATTFAADPKMAKAFETAATQYADGVAAREEATKQKTELNNWWTSTAQPAILNADSGGAQAKADAARYRTYLEDMKTKGYPVNDEWLGNAPKEEPKVTPAAYDPRTAALEFADATTKLYDLGEEYRDLYGAPLPGANTLLNEARAAGKPLTDYVRSKFNFDGKRSERAESKITERINAAVKDKEAALEAKYAQRANPLLAPAVTSRAAAVVEAQGDHAESWKTKQGRNEARKDRLLQFRNIAAKTA